MSGSLIIIELTKIYKFHLWKFVQFHRGVLDGVFPISHAIIRNMFTKFRPKTRYQTVGLIGQQMIGKQKQLIGSLIVDRAFQWSN